VGQDQLLIGSTKDSLAPGVMNFDLGENKSSTLASWLYYGTEENIWESEVCNKTTYYTNKLTTNQWELATAQA